MPGYELCFVPDRAVEQPLWTVLRRLSRPVSVHQLHLETCAHPNAIQHRLSRWVAAGLVVRLEGKTKRYSMSDKAPKTSVPPRVDLAGRISPRNRTARERLWSAMRVLRSFDIPTLMMAAAASRRSAEDYVNCLARSGHVKMTIRGNGMKGTFSRYQLRHNTGRRCPQVTRCLTPAGPLREVVDHNTGARFDISPGVVSLHSAASDPLADGGVG